MKFGPSFQATVRCPTIWLASEGLRSHKLIALAYNSIAHQPQEEHPHYQNTPHSDYTKRNAITSTRHVTTPGEKAISKHRNEVNRNRSAQQRKNCTSHRDHRETAVPQVHADCHQHDTPTTKICQIPLQPYLLKLAFARQFIRLPSFGFLPSLHRFLDLQHPDRL